MQSWLLAQESRQSPPPPPTQHEGVCVCVCVCVLRKLTHSLEQAEGFGRRILKKSESRG